MTKAEIAKMAFPLWCEQNGLGKPVSEYRFAKNFATSRNFRFDFAWSPPLMVAVECEGGVFTKGAHGSISGILRDLEKYNLAAAHGWIVLRQIPDKLCSAEMLDLIRMAHALRKSAA